MQLLYLLFGSLSQLSDSSMTASKVLSVFQNCLTFDVRNGSVDKRWKGQEYRRPCACKPAKRIKWEGYDSRLAGFEWYHQNMRRKKPHENIWSHAADSTAHSTLPSKQSTIYTAFFNRNAGDISLTADAVFTRDTFTWGKCHFTIEIMLIYPR